jgi:prepilin-type N-terminal cleavage/methylation domain-containing protein
MLGGRNKQSKQLPGYTIIEVLIVLAVSGMMFVIAINFINDKQGKAAFTQGTNELVSQIQNTIEQVTNGQFSDVPLNCSFSGGTTSVTSGTRPPGTNSTCIFVGKMLRFQADATTYDTLSLAGGRVTTNGAGTPITPSLSNIDPVVIGSLTREQKVPQQLLIKSVLVTDASGTPSNANVFNFGFAEGLGTVSEGSFQSGAQTVAMIYSSSTTAINASTLKYAKSATICLTDNKRYAQILVGSTDNSSQLSVRAKVVPTCS